jgi:hypothetical protein
MEYVVLVTGLVAWMIVALPGTVAVCAYKPITATANGQLVTVLTNIRPLRAPTGRPAALQVLVANA